MNIVLLAHPDFANHQSMPRYVRMLESGMKKRGHKVKVWSPKAFFFSTLFPPFINKWLGYIDQYIIFPVIIKQRSKSCSADTIFVFTDHALGIWVPLLKHRKHVVHCHDFLAQRSALGEIEYNKLSWSGRKYQLYIKNGYSQAKHFISVSQKTKTDLHQFLSYTPTVSDVVYNGLNPVFKYYDPQKARNIIGKKFSIKLDEGYLLHVGGNQWYKNRKGVIEIYNAWRSVSDFKLPLLLIGEKLSAEILAEYEQSPFRSNIYLLNNCNDEDIHLAYSGASIFLFPSLAEGFGWPIVEAMASGCPVITTNKTPMTEVAGDAAFVVPCRPYNKQATAWAEQIAMVIEKIVTLSSSDRELIIKKGILNSRRFNMENSLNDIEKIYSYILNSDKIYHQPEPLLF